MAHTQPINERRPDAAAYRDIEFLSVLSTGPLGTKEVASRVGCEHMTALDRLEELENRGIVTSTKIGPASAWRIDG